MRKPSQQLWPNEIASLPDLCIVNVRVPPFFRTLSSICDDVDSKSDGEFAIMACLRRKNVASISAPCYTPYRCKTRSRSTLMNRNWGYQASDSFNSGGKTGMRQFLGGRLGRPDRTVCTHLQSTSTFDFHCTSRSCIDTCEKPDGY